MNQLLRKSGQCSYPKPDGGQRPTSLSSLWLSAFCSARFAQLSAWQCQVCPPQLFGGLSGRCAAQAEVPQALWLDLCARQGTPALGVTHDRRKYFDRIKVPFVSQLLLALGLPLFLVKGFCGRYEAQFRFFKVFSSCRPSFRSSSLLQGCSLRLLACNALFSTLTRRVATRCPRVACSPLEVAWSTTLLRESIPSFAS